MPFLPGLAVVFVGIVGNDSARVDQQVHLLLQEQDVEVAKLDPRRARVLARHGDTSKAIVRELHADGVVGGELLADHGHRTLRMIVYAGDGAMKSLFEIPLTGRQLSRDEVAMLHANLADDITALQRALAHQTPAPEPPKVAVVEPKRTAAVAKDFDDDKIELEPTPATDAPAHEAAPVDTAEVRPEDLMAATARVDVEPVLASEPGLRIGAAAGIGITNRTFAPGPITLPGYSSAAVATIHLDAHVQPTAHVVLAVAADRTVEMTTPLADGDAPTTMSRWEATAGYRLDAGALHVTPLVGAGRRAFSIVSNDPSRSPDGSYDYLIAGTGAELVLGPVTLRGRVAFEPVIAGVEPTEMALGEATRWAVDVGGAIEVRPHAHVIVRAAADYQRFAWSWNMAGARGAGGAVDHYPTGTLSLGAEY